MTDNPGGTLWSREVLGELQLREYLEVLKRKKLWIALSTTALLVATTVFSLRLPNIYRSQTVILVDPQQVPESYVASTVSTSIMDRLATIKQQVMSPTRLKRVIDTLGLYPELRGKVPEQELIRMTQKFISVDVDESSGRLGTFRIAFQGRNPAMVAEVANELARMFIVDNSKAREKQFEGTAEFLDHQLQETKKQLERKEEELRRIKSQYIMDLPDSRDFHLQGLSNVRAQLEASRERVSRAQQERMMLQVQAGDYTPTIDLDAEGRNPTGSPTQAQIQKLEAQLAELRARYGPNYPDMRKLQARLEQLGARAATEEQAVPLPPPSPKPAAKPRRNPVLQAQLQQLEQEISEQAKLQATLQQQINFHMSKLERVPIIEQQVAGLMRDYDTFRSHYNALLDKKLSAQMASALENRQKGERFVILDAAQVPARPFGPNRLLISLAGLFGGLGSGLVLSILAEMTDESVRSEREAARILGKPVLAAIPHILTKKERRWRRVRAASALVGTVASSAVVGFLFSYVREWIF